MKLKRVKSVPGKRWKKGHSCATNPETTKFRKAAKNNNFASLNGESGLTTEALLEHNAGIPPKPQLCADSEDDKTLGKTFKTFATNYTTCTIPAFEQFFNNFTVESELQTRMLAIHAAVQEYIQQENLPENSTSYMCALMVSLEGIQDSEEDVVAALSLLAKVIRNVEKMVLRAKFGEYSKLFEDILKAYNEVSNSKLISNVIGCLSVLLRAQNDVQWTYPSTLDLFQTILGYTTHGNQVIRKSAQYNVSAILKSSFFSEKPDENETDDDEEEECEMDIDLSKKIPRSFHPAVDTVGKFIITNLKFASERQEGNATLYLLIFFQSVVSCLPEQVLEKCCSRVLGVMDIGDEVIRRRGFKVFGSLFSSELKEYYEAILTSETIEALINALTSNSGTQTSSLKLVPGINNDKLSTEWMDTVTLGIICLSKKNEADGIKRFNSWMKQLILFWKSSFDFIHQKIWYMVEYIFDEVIKPMKENISPYAQDLLQSFYQIEKCLSLQYEPAWPYVFKSLNLYFWVLGPYCTSELEPCLKSLVKMIETPDILGKKEIENTIGAAVHGMGPEAVMKVISLEITGNIVGDEIHFWILPILKKYVKETRLSFYVSYFVPIANKCQAIVKRYQEQGKKDSILVKTYEQIERQIWALLPSFSDAAVDVGEALPVMVHTVDAKQRFVQLIGNHIKNRSDTRLDFMAALRNMLKCSSASEVFHPYSKNFLPILFNVYLLKPRDKFPPKHDSNENDVIDSGQRLAAFSTIKAYISSVPPEQISIFFNLSFNKFDDESSDMFKKKSLLDLTVPFIPYLSGSSFSDILLKTRVYIETKSKHLQKSTYRVIEAIFCAESESSIQFVSENLEEIADLLFDSSNNVVKNATAHRLRCLFEFLNYVPTNIPNKECKSFFKKLIQESIKYCGRNNSSATRKAAFALLREVGDAVKRIRKISFEESFEYCYKLMPSLTPHSDITANTVLALMALSYLYDNLLDTKIALRSLKEIIELLLCNQTDVIKSCLGFIRVIFSQYTSVLLSDFVDDFVRNIIQMPIKIRCKFRLKIRDMFASLIRKFGSDRIEDLVPEDHPIHKMVLNIIKQDKRKNRAKQDEEVKSEDEQFATEAPGKLEEILEELDRQIEDDSEKKVDKTKLKEKTKGKKKKLTFIKEDEDVIVDLLDENSAQISSKKPVVKPPQIKKKTPQTDEEKYGFQLDKFSNKFIITEKWIDRKESKNNKNDEDYDEGVDDDEDFMDKDLAGFLTKKEELTSNQIIRDQNLKIIKSLKRNRKRTRSESSDAADELSEMVEAVESCTIERPLKKKKFNYGSEFRAKKAGGDVAQKDGVAPYAYVQFSKDKLNKRKQAKYAGQFKSLVKGAKKGAVKGSKSRPRRK